jgi:hypothetical protein
MNRFKSIRIALLAALVSGAVACGEYSSPTAPAAPINASDNLLGDLTGALGSTVGSVVKVVTGLVSYPEGRAVTAVRWSSSHAAGEQRVTGTIGYWGGTLTLPGSDFSVTFPVGALSQPTSITIVSKDGDYVAYDMLPHGLKFARPVTAVQRFRNTSVYGTAAANDVFAAYLADGHDEIGPGGVATAVEAELSVTISKLLGLLWVPDSQTWSLNHFSRYILASG